MAILGIVANRYQIDWGHEIQGQWGAFWGTYHGIFETLRYILMQRPAAGEIFCQVMSVVANFLVFFPLFFEGHTVSLGASGGKK